MHDIDTVVSLTQFRKNGFEICCYTVGGAECTDKIMLLVSGNAFGHLIWNMEIYMLRSSSPRIDNFLYIKIYRYIYKQENVVSKKRKQENFVIFLGLSTI